MEFMDIPMELQLEILQRMPVKSLYRMRCVSKTFLGTIDSPSLITRHTRVLIAGNNSGEPPQLICLGQICPYDTGREWTTTIATLQTMRYDGSAYLKKYKFSCNYKCPVLGEYMINFAFYNLVCIDVKDGRCMLIDPIRDQQITLPIDKIYSKDELDHKHYFTRYGMGYDDINDTYKIVRVSRIFSYKSVVVFAHVLTLGTDIWREIPSLPPARLHRRYAICAYGDMHWLTTRTPRCVIISLDVKTETFHRTPPLTLMSSKERKSLTFLITLRGSLTIVETFSLGNEAMNVEKWTMKDYFKKEWVKEYNITVKLEPAFDLMGLAEHGIYFSDPCKYHVNSGAGDFRYFLDLRSYSVTPLHNAHLIVKCVDIKTYKGSFISLQDFSLDSSGR